MDDHIKKCLRACSELATRAATARAEMSTLRDVRADLVDVVQDLEQHIEATGTALDELPGLVQLNQDLEALHL